jgi:hypothetical protein
LNQLYQARDACKQIIYETTGLSDIIRGASMASETATAQNIKAQFASIRLNDMKDDVARFARDLLRMKAEVICAKYQPEIILEVSGIANTPDAQFAPQAIALLKNEPLRNFTIDIETDTLVQLDEQNEKQSRMEFLNAAGGFLSQAVQATQANPDLAPLMMQMLLFGVRGFKAGRELEGQFEQTMQQLDQAQKQRMAQPPQPTPDQIKANAEAQKAQMDLQIEQTRVQLEQQKAQFEIQLEQSKMQFEQWKAQLDSETKKEIAQLQANTDLRLKGMDKSTDLIEFNDLGQQQASAVIQNTLEQSNQAMTANMAQVIQAIQASNEQQTQVLANMVAHLTKPKQVLRDSNGKIVGVQ